MDAPKCRLCHKRHYGRCASLVEPGPPDASDEAITEYYTDLRAPEKKIEASPSAEKVSENDTCPTCGTNLAARRKERERRRKYMKARRAEGKDDD